MELEKSSNMRGHWLHPPQGIEMDEYLVLSNKWIADAWQSVRGDVIDQSPTYAQYKRVIGRLGYFSMDVLRQAAIWMNSEEEEIANAGANVITHHYLNTAISAIDRMSAKFSNLPFDKEEMLSEGIVRIIDQVRRRGIRRDLAANLNSSITYQLNKQRRQSFTEEYEPREISVGLQPQLGRLEKTGSMVIVEEEREHGPEYNFKAIAAILTSEEAEALKMRFGFYNDFEYDEDFIADRLGVKASYVSQIIKDALGKLVSAPEVFEGYAPIK